MGNALRDRVIYFLSGYVPACLHVHSLLVTTSCDVSCYYCYHSRIPVQAHHYQPKVTIHVLPPLHIHFVREAGRGLIELYELVVVHKSG